MAKEINVYPPQNLLLDASELEPAVVDGVDVESNSNKELGKTNNLIFYPYELGNTLVFYKKAKLGDKNLLEMPIEDISSAEVVNEKKRIGKKILTNKSKLIPWGRQTNNTPFTKAAS